MRTHSFSAFVSIVACFVALSSARAETQWDQCAWQRVPRTVNSWLKEFPLKADENGWQSYKDTEFRQSRELNLQMRIVSACFEFEVPKSEFGSNDPQNISPFWLQRVLRKSSHRRPKPADLIEPRAFRCDLFFPDDAQHKFPAGTNFGFGDDLSKSQIIASRIAYGSNGELRSIDGPSTVRRVSTYSAAINEQKGPFVVAEISARRHCSYIQNDGSLKDA